MYKIDPVKILIGDKERMNMSMPEVLQQMIQDFARPVTRCDWRTCNLKMANHFTLRCLMNILREFIVERDKDRLTNEHLHLTKFVEENKDRYVFYRKRFMCFYAGQIHGNVTWIDLLDKEFKI